MGENQFINSSITQLEAQLREQTERLNNLQAMLKIGRRDLEFDLFCRRIQIAENFSVLPPEAMPQLHLADFYSEFWKLAGEAQRVTKFSEDEKNISRQILTQAQREQNPVRRQYLALLLIVFGELQESQKFLEPKFWSPQLQKDFATFVDWNELANNPLTPQARAQIEHNEQISAFLQEKYSALIKKYSHAVIDDKTCPRVKDYQIYFCWLQGEENLPPVIRCCYNSLKRNAGRYKIVFVDEKNFSRHVDIAPHILDKFRVGKISRTNFSDILRVNLLEQYGGLWLDATILVTDPLERHENFWQMNYFTQKYCHGKDNLSPYSQFISYGRWATGVQGTAILHNPLFAFQKEFFSAYLRDFDEFIDYYLIDFSINLAYDNIPFVQREIDAVPINHTELIETEKHLNEPYAAYPFDKISRNDFLHRLSWKIPLDMTRGDTVFREIQRRYAPETIK